MRKLPKEQTAHGSSHVIKNLHINEINSDGIGAAA